MPGGQGVQNKPVACSDPPAVSCVTGGREAESQRAAAQPHAVSEAHSRAGKVGRGIHATAASQLVAESTTAAMFLDTGLAVS